MHRFTKFFNVNHDLIILIFRMCFQYLFFFYECLKRIKCAIFRIYYTESSLMFCIYIASFTNIENVYKVYFLCFKRISKIRSKRMFYVFFICVIFIKYTFSRFIFSYFSFLSLRFSKMEKTYITYGYCIYFISLLCIKNRIIYM